MDAGFLAPCGRVGSRCHWTAYRVCTDVGNRGIDNACFGDPEEPKRTMGAEMEGTRGFAAYVTEMDPSIPSGINIPLYTFPGHKSVRHPLQDERVTSCENRGHYQLGKAAGRPPSAVEHRDMAKAATDGNVFVDDPRFNQKFDLLPSQGNSRDYTVKVTYADYGYRNEAHPEEETVLLWFSPMMASRLVGILRDKMARRDKIRIISFDRPGMGGTDAVSGESRIRICREIVIALLAKLGIQHVSLAAHSGGAVYALDTLLHHPGILSPSRPYLALGAPWLLPKHTSSTAMAMIQRLPNSAIGNAHQLMKFMNQVGGSSIGSSLARASSSMPSRTAPTTAEADDEVQLIQKTWPSVIKRIYSEGSEGISAEAVVLLQKVGNGTGWDDWGDYDSLIPRLVQSLRTGNRRLRLEIYYTEKDWMIGDAGSQGPAWFDGCWKTQAAEVVDHHSSVIAGADHDSIWDLQWDATRMLFESIRVVR